MTRVNKRTQSQVVLLFVYLMAFTLAWIASRVSNYPVLLKSAIAVALAVAIIFLGSLDFNNSSVFDPYWSVTPVMMVVYYWVAADGIILLTMSRWLDIRVIILFSLTLLYGIRLTWNFLRGWPGLGHEDWRYRDFRKRSGKLYWLVSFFAIHIFPALMVFGGTLSVWVVVTHGYIPLNLLDVAAVLITLGAIVLEAVADRQLRYYLKREGNAGKSCDVGLWAFSRHPNYLGEILFWWGLYLFAFSADPASWWVIVGPLAITLMFIFASIPMMEKHQLSSRNDYNDYRKRVPKLIPYPRKKS